jgi:23S rRNA (adenine-N6)-dimethyltransferase
VKPKSQPQYPRPPQELRFTQNFLRDPALVTRLVALARLQPGDTVLEIGPGKGIITRALAQQVGREGRVIAVELDAALAEGLRTAFKDVPQVEVRQADILHLSLETLPAGYAVFSNIPFNITSALLEFLLNPLTGPQQAHLILQRDALIDTGYDGAQTETFKSLMVKPLYDVQAVYAFQKGDFAPPPGVETALFAFEKRPTPLLVPAQYEQYKDFLAFVSKDRVGEGVWRRLFTPPQLRTLTDQTGLVGGRGLKSQSFEGMLAAYRLFATLPKAAGVVKGAMAGLREEQARREGVNRAGGHRPRKKL